MATTIIIITITDDDFLTDGDIITSTTTMESKSNLNYFLSYQLYGSSFLRLFRDQELMDGESKDTIDTESPDNDMDNNKMNGNFNKID